MDERPSMAWERAEGVRVQVDGDAWTDYPDELTDYVTPVLVRVQNNSSRRLRVGYDAFSLVGANGFEYQVLPPYSMTRKELGNKEPPPDLGQAYAQSGWYWDRHYPYDYEHYVEWAPNLPSRDMVRRALPEGVVRPAGGVEGFLYFDRAYDANALVFRMRLIDADTEEQVGQITIPFIAVE